MNINNITIDLWMIYAILAIATASLVHKKNLFAINEQKLVVKIVMLVAAPIVVVGWAFYFLALNFGRESNARFTQPSRHFDLLPAEQLHNSWHTPRIKDKVKPNDS